MDADSKSSCYSFLVYGIELCIIIHVLHDKGCQNPFYKKGVISFSQATGFLRIFWRVQICSGVSTLCMTIDMRLHVPVIWRRALQVTWLGSWNRVVSSITLPRAHHGMLFQVSLQKVLQDSCLCVLHWLRLTPLGAKDQILKYFSRINRGDWLSVTLYCFYWSCRLISSLQVMPERLKAEWDIQELCGTVE